jgi:hypothetical protein
MAVEVTIGVREGTVSKIGSFRGDPGNITTYSYSEEATPLEPSSNSGGVSQISFEAAENPDGGSGSIMLMDDVITLVDGANGTTTGFVSGVSMSNGIGTVTANSRMQLLMAERQAQPMSGTAEAIFRYYLGLAGISDRIVISDDTYTNPNSVTGKLTTTVYAVPGWSGVILDNVRQFAIAVGAEIALVSNNIVVRPVRGRTAINKRNLSQDWAVKRGQLAQNIEINYYNNRNVEAPTIFYPTQGGWVEDTQIYQVDAGEKLDVSVALDVSLLSLNQPICVAFVGKTQSSASQYAVIGKDGLPIPPTQWTQNGGKVEVSIGKDTKSIDITITGATTTQGPYRIAVASSATDAYSSLRLVGTGVFYTKETLTVPTGASAADTAQVIGVTVDSPFVSTISEAYTLGVRTAAKWAGADQTISVSTVGINRNDTSGSTKYPTFNDFNSGVGGKATSWTGKTFNQFAAEWSGKTFDDFNAYYYDIVRNDFANQAFGNVAGARVKFRDAYYRIDTANIGPALVSYTATADTLFSDFAEVWTLQDNEKTNGGYSNQFADGTPIVTKTTSYTFDDFAVIMEGRSFNDFAVTPLWRTYAGIAAQQPRS